MGTHTRTAIRRIAVRGYRSVKDVVIDGIPNIAVLHGPNGAGKSNLLRAAQLLLRATQVGTSLPVADRAISLLLPDASTTLRLRPDDFHAGGLPEIRVELTIDLGHRALERIPEVERGDAPVSFELRGVFQYDGDAAIRFWFERAHIVEPAASPSVGATPALGGALEILRGELARTTSPQDALRSDHFRHVLLPQLLQISEAYRVPGGADDPQKSLFEAFLSEDPRQRDAARRLGRRLATAGLFGATGEEIVLLPVDSRTYGEKQVRLRHPMHGELPLRNLGSGEQQLVIMLAQRVITPFPIAQIEEPEAHLHTTLMESLARMLLQSVQGDGGTPDVDQLWIATHHHQFAIAPEFFDVSLDERGATRVIRKKRDLAVTHFYEPSPYWDTLRTLLESGMSPDTVVSLDADGRPIRAGDVLASIQGDRKLANDFVAAATRAFVLSLAREEPEA